MKEFLDNLRACIQGLSNDYFKVSNHEWKDYRSNPVAIWVNYKCSHSQHALACDVAVMSKENRDYISVTFFWRMEKDLYVDSNADIGTLSYWENRKHLGYTPVAHKDGQYRLGKDYNIKKITHNEIARELFDLFFFIAK